MDHNCSFLYTIHLRKERGTGLLVDLLVRDMKQVSNLLVYLILSRDTQLDMIFMIRNHCVIDDNRNEFLL